MNFEDGTEVENSCGATLNGQHWIIGGYNEERQVRHLQVKRQKYYVFYLDKSNRWLQRKKSWYIGF